MQVPLPDDPLSVFSRQIFTINGLLLRDGNAVAAPLGLTVAKWHVLARANYKPRTVSEIARYIGVTRQGVQRTADALVREGLLKYEDNPRDKRAQLVVITREGARVLSAVYEADAQWSKEVMSRLGSVDLETLIGTLETIISTLSARTGGTHENA